MLVLSEYSPKLKPSAGTAYLKKMTDAAKILGIEILYMKQGEIDSLEEVLFYKRPTSTPQKVFWIGYVPKYDLYCEVQRLLSEKNLTLINSPVEFSQSEYFDQFYALIKDFTIESGIAQTIEEARGIANKLGYPVFLKGTIQSLKKFGWENCIAQNEEELLEIFQKLKTEKDFSLGKIIIRKFVDLVYRSIGGNGIPQAHEYRYFVLNEKIIGSSFYWNGENPFSISDDEKVKLNEKVITVAKSVKVPFISVDVGETTKDDWKIIEIGDGQFSDIRNISPLTFWNQIKASFELY